MKTKMAFSLIASVNLILSGATFAAGAKSYQVTGTVVAATGSMVTVQKGTDRLEIDLDPTTKGSAALNVGSTITITYVMSATKVEASGGSAATTTSSPKPGAPAETTPVVPARSSPAPTP